MMKTVERWRLGGGRGRVAHLVHERHTGWAQTERYGALVFACGRVSNESVAAIPELGTLKCLRCSNTLDVTSVVVTEDPVREHLRNLCADLRVRGAGGIANEIEELL